MMLCSAQQMAVLNNRHANSVTDDIVEHVKNFLINVNSPKYNRAEVYCTMSEKSK